MAQVHPVTSSSGLGGATTLSHFIMSAECVIELAKNAVNPVKCEWGIGTKAECNIMLGSWRLLRKHLHMIHSYPSKDGFLCYLPRCNHQLHLNHLDFTNHLDSAHLSRLMFQCPIPGCEISLLRGTESLLKHYEECHKDMDGEDFDLPSSLATWEPISSPNMVVNGLAINQVVPTLSHVGNLGLGTALIGNVAPKRSQRLDDWVQESVDEWLPSQVMSQGSAFTPSQGTHPMVRRKRTRARQLEKVKLRVGEEEEEEGLPKVILDDLVGFDGDSGDPLDQHNDDPSRRNCRCSNSWLGVTVGTGLQSPDHEKKEVRLARRANEGIIFGQWHRQLLVDLSCPKPLITDMSSDPDKVGNPGMARVPKSILFDVLAQKVEEMERTGVIDRSLM